MQSNYKHKHPRKCQAYRANGFYYSRMEESEGGVLFLRYKKDLKEKDNQQKTGLPPESL